MTISRNNFDVYKRARRCLPLKPDAVTANKGQFTLRVYVRRNRTQELSSCWDGRRFGNNRHGPKSGGCCAPFRGEKLGPHLTRCGLGRGLPPCQVASWSIQPFGRNRHEPKIEGSSPLFLRGAGSSSYTMWPGPRPLSLPSGMLIHPAVCPQQTWAENWGHIYFFFWGGGDGSPSNTMCPGPGLPQCQVASWSIQPSGHNTPTSQDRQATGQTRDW